MDLTFAQLIAQVTGRLNRDDLNQVARDHISDRINYYAKEFFYSAEVRDTSIMTIAGTRYYTLPTRWAQVKNVSVLQGVWIPMERRTDQEIDEMDVQPSALQSLPSYWALFNGTLRIWPCGGGYNLELNMDRSPAEPVADSDITFWSTDAQTLIIAAAAESICKTYLNDPVREARFKNLRMEEEASLTSKSIRARGGVNFQPYL